MFNTLHANNYDESILINVATPPAPVANFPAAQHPLKQLWHMDYCHQQQQDKTTTSEALTVQVLLLAVLLRRTAGATTTPGTAAVAHTQLTNIDRSPAELILHKDLFSGLKQIGL